MRSFPPELISGVWPVILGKNLEQELTLRITPDKSGANIR